MAFLIPDTCSKGLATLVVLCAALMLAGKARAEPPLPLPERELKVAFLYNFMLYTEWPADVGTVLNLCLYGTNRLEQAVGVLQGKQVNLRAINLQRRGKGDALHDCQLIFMGDPVSQDGVRVLGELRGKPVLTVAASPGAAHLGVGLNMVIRGDKIAFEVNLPATRAARIKLSSKLLQLSTAVIQ